MGYTSYRLAIAAVCVASVALGSPVASAQLETDELRQSVQQELDSLPQPQRRQLEDMMKQLEDSLSGLSKSMEAAEPGLVIPPEILEGIEAPEDFFTPDDSTPLNEDDNTGGAGPSFTFGPYEYFEWSDLDTDGDDNIDWKFLDSDGDGQVDLDRLDPDRDGYIDSRLMDTDGDGQMDPELLDMDRDGQIDWKFLDADGDGQVDTDRVYPDSDGEYNWEFEENYDPSADMSGFGFDEDDWGGPADSWNTAEVASIFAFLIFAPIVLGLLLVGGTYGFYRYLKARSRRRGFPDVQPPAPNVQQSHYSPAGAQQPYPQGAAHSFGDTEANQAFRKPSTLVDPTGDMEHNSDLATDVFPTHKDDELPGTHFVTGPPPAPSEWKKPGSQH